MLCIIILARIVCSVFVSFFFDFFKGIVTSNSDCNNEKNDYSSCRRENIALPQDYNDCLTNIKNDTNENAPNRSIALLSSTDNDNSNSVNNNNGLRLFSNSNILSKNIQISDGQCGIDSSSVGMNTRNSVNMNMNGTERDKKERDNLRNNLDKDNKNDKYNDNEQSRMNGIQFKSRQVSEATKCSALHLSSQNITDKHCCNGCNCNCKNDGIIIHDGNNQCNDNENIENINMNVNVDGTNRMSKKHKLDDVDDIAFENTIVPSKKRQRLSLSSSNNKSDRAIDSDCHLDNVNSVNNIFHYAAVQVSFIIRVCFFCPCQVNLFQTENVHC